VFDIVTSVVSYLGVSVLYLALDVSYLLMVALMLPAAGFLVRTFVGFHDYAHGSFLPSKRATGLVGRCLGLFVLSPFQRWRHDHAIHHATSGDLERGGVGDIITLTVGE
jgi:acyl-lipid omega-6 desaturase (Delta-12 desaturase)